MLGHDGIIDKLLMGDAIMARVLATRVLRTTMPAIRAVQMQIAMDELCRSSDNGARESRYGVNTGKVMTGSIGLAARSRPHHHRRRGTRLAGVQPAPWRSSARPGSRRLRPPAQV